MCNHRAGSITLEDELARLGPIVREATAATAELSRLVYQISRGNRTEHTGL